MSFLVCFTTGMQAGYFNIGIRNKSLKQINRLPAR